MAQNKQNKNEVKKFSILALLNLDKTLISWQELPKKDRFTYLLFAIITFGIIFPGLGSAGFYDCWETHYAEVARSMAQRDDYLYPYWKNAYFFSKPILLFWLTAPFYKILGAGQATGELSTWVELGGRIPMAVFTFAMLSIVFWTARRLWNLRAAFIGGIAVATVPYVALLSRQAITDPLYVAPMSAALCLLALGFTDDDISIEKRITARIPTWLIGFFAMIIFPQMWEIGRSGEFLNRVTTFGSEVNTRIVASFFLLIFAGVLLYLLKRFGRDPYIHTAAALLALATLGKGPHVVVFTLLILVPYLFFTNKWQLLKRMSILSGALLYICLVAPWVIVMLLFKGKNGGHKTWFQRFIMHDLLNRLGGVHGQRGDFTYYIRCLGTGMFPWSPIALLAFIASLNQKFSFTKVESREKRFSLWVILWASALFTFFAFTNTKFHHYIYPVSIPLALLIGWWLDQLMNKKEMLSTPIILFSTLSLAILGRDLFREPWQFIDLFTYHYVNYKPKYYFPNDVIIYLKKNATLNIFQLGILIMTIISIASITFALFKYFKSQNSTEETELEQNTDALSEFKNEIKVSGQKDTGFIGSFLNIFNNSKFDSEGVQLDETGHLFNKYFAVAFLSSGILMSIFLNQIYMPQLAQHWSHRYILHSYYEEAQVGEPLISFQMDWKGETFYSHNTELQIKKKFSDLNKVLKKPGREFVIIQSDRYEKFKKGVSKDLKNKVKILDQSNKKWFLLLVDE